LNHRIGGKKSSEKEQPSFEPTHFVLRLEEMARRKMKGGEDSFIGNMAAAGIGAYAAKNSNSMGELLWTLAKYALVILAILLVVSLVFWLIGLAVPKEGFVPTVPSKEGDERAVTPAGNVIMY
jgi:hypothetical protein